MSVIPGQQALLAAVTKQVEERDKRDQENADKLLQLQQEEREIDAAKAEKKEAYETAKSKWYTVTTYTPSTMLLLTHLLEFTTSTMH